MERRILAGASPRRDARRLDGGRRQGSPNDGADAQPNTRTNRRGLTPLSRFDYEERAVRGVDSRHPSASIKSASATMTSTVSTVTAAPIFRAVVPSLPSMALIDLGLWAIHNKQDRQLEFVRDYGRSVTQ